MFKQTWATKRSPQQIGRLGLPLQDPSVWRSEEMLQSNEWIYPFSERDIEDIHDGLEAFQARHSQDEQPNPANFPLPHLGSTLRMIAKEIMLGRGFVLMRGFPFDSLSSTQAETAYWGVCSYLGQPISASGTVFLSHVRDISDAVTDRKLRDTMTTVQMAFHCDRSDILTLACEQPAKRGGEHRICSSGAIYNEMVARNPQLAEELGWRFYYARLGRMPDGENSPWSRQPVFSFTDGYFAARSVSKGIFTPQQSPEVPQFTDSQIEALNLHTVLAEELSFSINLERGDISLLCNHLVVHSRSEFEDYSEPARKRHLLRMWLSNDLRPICSDIMREVYRIPGSGQI
jgi:hypothetical protein